MKLDSRWTKAVANQYSTKTLVIVPYVMLVILLVCFALAGLGYSDLCFSLLTLDFFMFADYIMVRLARQKIHFLLSGLLATIGAAIIFGMVTLVLGFLFKW